VLAVAGMPLHASIELARRAEAAGCFAVAAGESTYDSFAASTLLAAATRRTRVMTAVTTWTRPPVSTATGALTLAELTGDRFVLGLGSMPEAWNRDHYGIDPAHAVPRMREYVDCVRGALDATTERPFSYEGEFFTIRSFARAWPARSNERLPIHLAATRPLMARLGGEVADGVLYNVIHTRAWIRDVLEPQVSESERRVGRKRIERGVMVRVVPHPAGGRGLALDQARVAVAPYTTVPYLADVLRHHGWGPEQASTEALEELVQVGTVDELVDKLLVYRDLVDWVLLAPPRMLPSESMARWYEVVLERLLPALRSAA
jgi:alkanesulfonate monooxygenase SsuD/methylene tetrahydromethanopterin reductase-like flavin-dependent oxidoreductase (luciferase family)